MMTEAQLYAAMEQLILSNKELAESNRLLAKEEKDKVDVMYKTLITGDPENSKPSVLEVLRDHGDFINGTKKAGWIVLGAVLVAIPAGILSVIFHVFSP